MVTTRVADNISSQRRVTDFAYDGSGNLVTMTARANPSGSSSDDRITTFDYYSGGRLKSANGPRTDVSDITTYGDPSDAVSQGYDRTGGPKQVKDANGKVRFFEFTPYGPVGKMTNRDGHVTKVRYDERDNAVEVIDPEGSRASSTYDANDNVIVETSPRGTETSDPADFETRYTYDANDWVTGISRPGETESLARSTRSISYFDDGLKQSETNPAPATTSFTYYNNRQLKEVSLPATTSGPSAISTYEYDLAGRNTRTVSPATNSSGSQRPETKFLYTPSGKISGKEVTSPAGGFAVTDFAYNAHGEQTQILGPRTVSGERQETRVTVNSFGEVTNTSRLIGSGRFVDSVAEYDKAGNKTRTTQPYGSSSTLESLFSYDKLNRLTSQTKDPFNPDHRVDYLYSDEGLQTQRIDKKISDGTILRTVATGYNTDNTVASEVATDPSGATLAKCNYLSGSPSGGYDADNNLIYRRTVSGASGCSGGTDIKTESFSYDHRGFPTGYSQSIRSPENGVVYTKNQTFAYRNDGSVDSQTHDGNTTSFTNSPGGLMESMTDWRGKSSSFAYVPSGAPTSKYLGGTTFSSAIVQASILYKPDGSPSSHGWFTSNAVRRHGNITYDIGGLKISEDVEVALPFTQHPLGGQVNVVNTSGTANFTYDLLDRLASYTSPFKMNATDPATPKTTYSLDDAGNVTREVTKVIEDIRAISDYTYTNGRLTLKSTQYPLLNNATPNVVDETFAYSTLGEETLRVASQSGVEQSRNASSYDPSGHTGRVDDQLANGTDVSYLYDLDHRLISRTETPAGDAARTTLYFYLGGSETIAEETDGAGATVARYILGFKNETLGQLTFRYSNGHKDPTDTSGTFVWLLDDANGNVATHLSETREVQEQAAFDPYGKPEPGGSTNRPTAPGSSVGYQRALTDKTTGNLLLGPRQYDPKTMRFTSADFYVAGSLDMQLGTDELTGNRYLFAAANPTCYDDDGHKPFSFKKCREIFNQMWDLILGRGKYVDKKGNPHGLLRRFHLRAKFRDFGTPDADNHIRNMKGDQEFVKKRLRDWDQGSCDDKHWPGGTAESLEMAKRLAELPDPGHTGEVPSLAGIKTRLTRFARLGGYWEVAKDQVQSVFSPSGATI